MLTYTALTTLPGKSQAEALGEGAKEEHGGALHVALVLPDVLVHPHGHVASVELVQQQHSVEHELVDIHGLVPHSDEKDQHAVAHGALERLGPLELHQDAGPEIRDHKG